MSHRKQLADVGQGTRAASAKSGKHAFQQLPAPVPGMQTKMKILCNAPSCAVSRLACHW